jgi:hypothetical protein
MLIISLLRAKQVLGNICQKNALKMDTDFVLVVINANFTNCLAAGVVVLDVNTLFMTFLDDGLIVED